tara:strand:+ start:54 stop:2558 length:2505 start_codon:yes stop_codon:yes gene_type:complete
MALTRVSGIASDINLSGNLTTESLQTSVVKVGTAVTISAGIISATSYEGSGADLDGIDATSLKDSQGNTKLQANEFGLVITGIATGDLSGNATSATTAGTATTATNALNVKDTAGNLRITTNNAGMVITGIATVQTGKLMVGNAYVDSTAVGVGTQTTAGRDAGVGTMTGSVIFNIDELALQVYNGDESGWALVNAPIPTTITATGGVVNDYTDGGTTYRSHTFTQSGTFNVTSAQGTTALDYLVVGGGGGGGGNYYAGGGGGGALIFGQNLEVFSDPGTYTITVGGGGKGGDAGAAPYKGTLGGDSVLAAPTGPIATAAGGGFGSGYQASPGNAGGGGSGGGARGGDGGASETLFGAGSGSSGGADNTASPPAGWGNPGGQGHYASSNVPTAGGGGGGGAGASGGTGPITATPTSARNGGAGLNFNVNGTSLALAGGGGAGAWNMSVAGGFGGGPTGPRAFGAGDGALGSSPIGNRNNEAPGFLMNGSVNRGGGGGGANLHTGGSPYGGSGGSGIVILRYALSPSQIVAAKATGGNITTFNGQTIHTFTTSGTFAITDSSLTSVKCLVIGAGGGGGGGYQAGGGGAGALHYRTAEPVNPSPGSYPVTVGAGGRGGNYGPNPQPVSRGAKGGDSAFASLTAEGGGYGNTYWAASDANPGGPGGSGGGAGGNAGSGTIGTGSGDSGHPGAVDVVSPPNGWGNDGGASAAYTSPYAGGGGGGASSAGANSSGTGAGGAGATYSISGVNVAYAGGGGGGGYDGTSGTSNVGGTGGGGRGGRYVDNFVYPEAGSANTGGGGGGGAGSGPVSSPPTSRIGALGVGAFGGSGIVIISYPS